MSRWPYAYLSGPQKLSKIEFGGTVTGRFSRVELAYQDLMPRTLPRPVVDPESKLITMDFGDLEARVLGWMQEEKS